MEASKPVTHPWSEWGGDGQQLVFLHGNGFPPGSYKLLFHDLSATFRVSAFAARPLWPASDPSDIAGWEDLAEDLHGSMEARGLNQVTGVGHSLGGVLSVMAAAADPRLFDALVLIDPVVFSGVHSLFWGTLKSLGFGHRLPLIRGARRRQDRFPDLDTVREVYGGKPVFYTWQSDALDDYVRAAFVETGEGDVELRYSKAWEARIFELTPASVWRDLRRVAVPMLVVRGALSDTFLTGAAEKVKRELPNATVLEIPDTTHFLPMERPAIVAKTIVDWFTDREEVIRK